MSLVLNGSGSITGATTLASTVTSPTLTTPVITSTLGVGGATPSASGAGITFPVAQSASSDANTLDDYEEGTFTPVMSSGSGSITSQTCYGKYTKVGNTVTVVISATIVTVGSASGNMSISGLPFLPVSATTGRPSVSLVREDNSTGYGYMAITGNGQSFFTLFTLSTNGSPPWTSGYQYTFNATYLTS